MTLGQPRLDLEARYLCGDHCGLRFYEVVNRVCPDIKDEFLALFCSQNTPSPVQDPTYCVYAELYVTAILGVADACSQSLQNNTCSMQCLGLLDSIVQRIGCCVHSRYNSSIGFLRPGDNSVAMILSSYMLYELCGVDIPGPCEPAYVNGIPVYTDVLPTTMTTTMMSAASTVTSQLEAAILGFSVATLLMYYFY